MAKYNFILDIKENGVWTQYMQFVRPLTDRQTLDESLDEGVIKLGATYRKECFKPFLPVRIMIYEVNGLDNIEKLSELERKQYLVDTIYRLTANCSVEQRAFKYNIGEDRYAHILNLIEPTKLLEREICDTMTFTNYMSRDYASGMDKVNSIFQIESGKGFSESSVINHIFYASPYFLKKSMKMLSCEQAFEITFASTSDIFPSLCKTDLITPSGEATSFTYSQSYDMKFSEEGTYKIKYFLATREKAGIAPVSIVSFTYLIAVLKVIENKITFSVASAINRLLSAGTTRREGIESQKYFLDPSLAEKYSHIQAPEFHITRCTLWEALSQIGDYIHAVPRLKWNELTDKPDIVTFDELGGDSEYILPATSKIVVYSSSNSIDEFCNTLDSTAENLLNTRDKVQGSVTEPFANGYQTVRCEEGSVEISDDKGAVLTQFPIYRLDKLEVLHNGETLDITPYVYEAAEYGTLSAYGGTYPYSTAYALKYSHGDNKITNFSYKQETMNLFDSLAEGTVMHNIFDRLQKGKPSKLTDLAFRVTYIPLVSLRVTAKKPYADTNAQGNTLLYNQAANTVESESYGENLKGAVARLGNGEEMLTFMVANYSQIPKIGQIYGGKYIAAVTTEYDLNSIKVSVLLVENFNRLAQYLGLYTNYRLFDVSEKQSAERFINYSENVIIGDSVNTDSLAGITSAGVTEFAKVFAQNSVGTQVSAAVASGGTGLPQVVKSCISIGLGNSLAFNWGYADNYSAGSKSVDAKESKRAAQLVAYGDVYGEINKMELWLCGSLPSTFGKNEYDNLPEYNGATEDALLDYSAHPLIIQKDSRECLNVTTQIHFVTNRKSIVIGSQLAQNNPLVTECNPSKSAKLYLLPYKLNMLNSIFNLSGGQKIAEDVSGMLQIDAEQKNFVINGFANTTNIAYQAWAFMQEIYDEGGGFTGYGRLYIGENIALAPQQMSKQLNFTFKSNKED